MLLAKEKRSLLWPEQGFVGKIGDKMVYIRFAASPTKRDRHAGQKELLEFVFLNSSRYSSWMKQRN